jgi:hypothetical protein
LIANKHRLQKIIFVFRDISLKMKMTKQHHHMFYIIVSIVQLLEYTWQHLRCIFVFYQYKRYGVLNFRMCSYTIRKEFNNWWYWLYCHSLYKRYKYRVHIQLSFHIFCLEASEVFLMNLVWRDLSRDCHKSLIILTLCNHPSPL